MKTRLWLAVAASFLLLAINLPAADSNKKPAEKKQLTPAETAFESYKKARAAAAKNPDRASFEKMISAALAWLGEYSSDEAADELVHDLGTFGFTALKKDQRPLRTAYASQLQYQIVDLKYKAGVTQPTKLAVAAVEAAVADAQVRDEFSPANLSALREKIDALAAMPDSARYLVNAELSFVEILTYGRGPAAGEKQLRRLTESSDKAIAEAAQRQLSVAEMRREPLALKFNSLDGKEVDFAQYRGKVLAVAFWSSHNETSRKELEALRELYSDYRKKGFEVVTVSYDKESDKEHLEKTVKDMKLTWPVCYEGKGSDNPLGKKLSIGRVPATAIFDAKGLLVANNVRGGRVGTEVRKLLKIEEPPADWGSTPKRKK